MLTTILNIGRDTGTLSKMIR